MGKIFRVGERVGFRREDEEFLYPVPDGAADVLDVDFDANAALLAALDSDLDSFRFVAGVLQRRGVPVVLVPATARYALRALVRALNGQQIQNLSNADFRRVVALLLLDKGWLDRDGTIRIH